MFLCLRDAKINEVYRKAAQILSEREYSQTLTFDPYTGAIDLLGALMLACGASEKLLAEGNDDPQTCGIPPANVVKVFVSADYFEAMAGKNIADWCETHEKHDAIQALLRLANRIEMTVAKPISG